MNTYTHTHTRTRTRTHLISNFKLPHFALSTVVFVVVLFKYLNVRNGLNVAQQEV